MLLRPLIALTLLLIALPLTAVESRLSYQGSLEDQGQPAQGSYDLRFRLFDEAGDAVSEVLVHPAVDVTGGLFMVELDFGAEPFNGEPRFLEVEVRRAGIGDFTTLAPRSRITATPYAQRAAVADFALGAANVWGLSGNSGTDSAINFIGTTDATPLEFRTQNVRSLRIEPSAELFNGLPITTNVIAGSHANEVTPGVRGATIAGGGVPAGNSDPFLNFENPNRVTDSFGTVGGGFNNQAGDGEGSTTDRAHATVAGGQGNTASGSASTVAGGTLNTASGTNSTVGGGFENTGSGGLSTVGGGQRNTASGSNSTVSGGQRNTASGSHSTVSGGERNTASGLLSTVSGGFASCAGGTVSWAGGSNAKVRPASDPGTGSSCNGLGSYPGGSGDQGTFVWADSQLSNFVSTGSNQFLVRAAGGMGVGTNAPEAQLHVSGTGTSGATVGRFENPAGSATVAINSSETGSSSVSFQSAGVSAAAITRFDGGTFTLRSNGAIQLRTGGNVTRFQLSENGGISVRRGPGDPDADKAIQVGTNTSTGNGAHLTNTGVWTNASSRSFKHAFEALDPVAVLERVVSLPVTRWSYRGQDEIRHIGPTAEDFHAAFGLGGDERYIGAVDADGVALAAIQGLNARLEAQNDALRDELASVRAEVLRLHEREDHEIKRLRAELAMLRELITSQLAERTP